MSGKAGSIGSIFLGVALIVGGIVAAVTPGGQAGVGAIFSGLALLAGGAIGLAFTPKALNRDTVKAADLQIATTAEGVPIPVIFGTQRVIGNFMNWERGTFRSVKVLGRSDGSKGGDAPPADIIGFDHYLTFEYALCMGPVDELVQAYGVPGEKVMMGKDPTPVSWGSDEYKEVLLDSLDPGSAAGSERGLVRLYRGLSDQLRIVASDPYNYQQPLDATGRLKFGYRYKITAWAGNFSFTSFGAPNNSVGTTFVSTGKSGPLGGGNAVIEYQGINYRHICWGLFMDFRIGRVPQPKSYHFVLRRFPSHNSSFEMKRPDGTAISGFNVRGSSDAAKPGYNEANPSAIIYEALTDTVWGRGLDPAIFDEASFVECAQYFAAKHIGMSFTLDSPDKVIQFIDGIRLHLRTLLVWDGEFLKLRCLLDMAQTHGQIQTLKKAELKNMVSSRPLWHSTVNEIRAEINNKDRNYRPDAVPVHDLGNWAITGRMNPKRITFSGFSDYNTARRQAFRLLREVSYPGQTLTFETNRFKSQIEVGDVVKIIWDEADDTATIYALITKLEDSNSETDDIKVTAIEDITLLPVSGEQATPTIPTVAGWEKISDLATEDLQLWQEDEQVASTSPFEFVEAPPLFPFLYTGSNGAGCLFAFAESPGNQFTFNYTYFANENNTYSAINTVYSYAALGNLLQDWVNTGYIDRTSNGFVFSLENPDSTEAAMLSVFSGVSQDTQDLEDVITRSGAFCIIGEEYMQIGIVEKIGTNQYRARNIVRGRMGSKINAYQTGKRVCFAINKHAAASHIITSYYVDGLIGFNPLPINRKLRFKMEARSAQQVVKLDNDNYHLVEHTSVEFDNINNDTIYRAVANTVMAPELYAVSLSAGVYTIKIRPRWLDRGAGTADLFSAAIWQVTPAVLPITYSVYIHSSVISGSLRQWKMISVTPTWLKGESVDSSDGISINTASGIVTIGGIPDTFTAVAQGGLSGGTFDTKQIRVIAALGGRTSVDDLIINL